MPHDNTINRYKVSTKAKGVIDEGYNAPLLNVAVINPHIYDMSSSLQQIRVLRQPFPFLLEPPTYFTQSKDARIQLKIIGEFLRTCKDGELLTKQLGSRLHLLDRCVRFKLEIRIVNMSSHISAHIYSLRDLVDAKVGKLLPFLEKIVGEYIRHITSCAVCSSLSVLSSLTLYCVRSVVRGKGFSVKCVITTRSSSPFNSERLPNAKSARPCSTVSASKK